MAKTARGTDRREAIARARKERAEARRVAQQQARTAKAQLRFLKAFAVNGNISDSCRQAKVGRRTLYNWLAEDEAFKSIYTEAREEAIDLLELEAVRRATTGWDEPVYQGGKRVGTVRKFSDNILITLLKAKRPNEYRERVEHSGPKGGPIPVNTTAKVTFYLPNNGRDRAR